MEITEIKFDKLNIITESFIVFLYIIILCHCHIQRLYFQDKY